MVLAILTVANVTTEVVRRVVPHPPCAVENQQKQFEPPDTTPAPAPPSAGLPESPLTPTNNNEVPSEGDLLHDLKSKTALESLNNAWKIVFGHDRKDDLNNDPRVY